MAPRAALRELNPPVSSVATSMGVAAPPASMSFFATGMCQRNPMPWQDLHIPSNASANSLSLPPASSVPTSDREGNKDPHESGPIRREQDHSPLQLYPSSVPWTTPPDVEVSGAVSP